MKGANFRRLVDVLYSWEYSKWNQDKNNLLRRYPLGRLPKGDPRIDHFDCVFKQGRNGTGIYESIAKECVSVRGEKCNGSCHFFSGLIRALDDPLFREVWRRVSLSTLCSCCFFAFFFGFPCPVYLRASIFPIALRFFYGPGFVSFC